jgi:hypothetical protein
MQTIGLGVHRHPLGGFEVGEQGGQLLLGIDHRGNILARAKTGRANMTELARQANR